MAETKPMNKILLAIILCVVLGFAPLGSTPHLFGKVEWIMGGAVGMQLIDWFDFFLHLSPFIFLLVLIFGRLKHKA